jgi:hypothetical protein
MGHQKNHHIPIKLLQVKCLKEKFRESNEAIKRKIFRRGKSEIITQWEE